MIYAKFTHDYDEVTTNEVTQWDYGRTLRIEGLKLPSAVRIDFCISGEQTTIARIGTTKDNVTDVVIPDSLLEQSQTIVAYVYLNDTTTGKTVRTINIPVIARPMPEEHDTPESKELFAEAIEVVNEIATRVEEDKSATKTYSDSAKESLESTIEAKDEAVKAIQDEGATQIEALQGFASAIKSKVTGNVIKVDDVSPVEHDLKVKADGATTVSRYGKNLIPYPFVDFVCANSELTVTDLGDGGVLLDGSVSTDTFINLNYKEINANVVCNSYNNSIFTMYDTNNKKTFIFIKAGTTCDNIKFYPQMEIGNTVTNYERGVELQTAEVVDGTVTSLTSVSPNMTLIADNGTIEVEYNIDTKTYIDRKIAELMME